MATATIRAIRQSWDAANIEAAERILANAHRFGGETAFPATWARMLLERMRKSSGPSGGLTTSGSKHRSSAADIGAAGGVSPSPMPIDGEAIAAPVYSAGGDVDVLGRPAEFAHADALKSGKGDRTDV